MTISLIETVLIPALRSSPGTFPAKMEQWMIDHPTWTAELNAIVTDINTASGFVGAAMAAKWVSGTTYTDGVLVWSPTTRLTYRRKGTGAGTTDPASDTTNWAHYPVATQAEAEAGTSDLVMMSPLRAQQHLAYQFPKLPGVYSARTTNTILAAADNRTFIDVTSDTFSQTLTAAATLGAGWHCFYSNSGTGVVTIDPNGAETINGSATLALYEGESGYLYCTGTAFLFLYAGRVKKSGAGSIILATSAGSSVTVPASGTLATTGQILPVASQSDMETATNNGAITTPLAVKWHPGVAKAWVQCGATGNIISSHNITSLTDDGTGQVTVTIATDFSSANYVITAMTGGGAAATFPILVGAATAGAFTIGAINLAGAQADPGSYRISCFGDQ